MNRRLQLKVLIFTQCSKKSQFCEDFTGARGEAPDRFNGCRCEMLSLDIKSLFKYFISSETFPGSLSVLLCQTHLSFPPGEVGVSTRYSAFYCSFV